ncbi:MAG: SHOCT domain-containing protein [Chloroflexi bacterium]|nr:SHOCT domain-containing protein [Chloroflexota bacterium]
MPRPSEEIVTELRELGYAPTEGELQVLSRVLFSGEHVEHSFAGIADWFMGDIHGLKDRERCLLILSDRRVLGVGPCYPKPLLNHHEIYFADIGHFDWEERHITLRAYTDTVPSIYAVFQQKNFDQTPFDNFVDAVRSTIDRIKRNGLPKSSVRLVQEIERLATLKERGMLTDEEFDLAKRRLLQG